jgi:hypothetical protein
VYELIGNGNAGHHPRIVIPAKAGIHVPVVIPAKAGIQVHPSFPRKRESMFTRHSRESGNPCSPVIPAKAGIHVIGFWILRQQEADRQQMDSRFRGNDDIPHHPLSRE